MKEVVKVNRIFESLVDVLNCINEQKPKEKKKEYNEQKLDSNGVLIELLYTIEDKKGAKHIFKITPEGERFKLYYTSLGEYPDYVEDDLDFLL